jgi:putative hemolysin
MSRLVRMILSMLAVTVLAGACATPAPQSAPTPQPQIANPASVNCINLGGKLEIRTRPDGGQYGVCLFEDNRQCDEWALFYGDCPIGGLKISGYVTEAAQFCAITGGTYQVTGNSNTAQEQGTCTFKNGKVCDAGQYFAGTCDRNVAAGQESYSEPFAYCAAVGTIDAPDARYTGEPVPAGVVLGLIRQGVVTADAPVDFQNHAVWRCMDGSVWACHFGANLPCQEKADTSQTPTAEMDDFCKNNLNADVIPAAVTGRATVYEWRCTDGKPTVVKQVFTPDAQGFLKDFWYQLTP